MRTQEILGDLMMRIRGSACRFLRFVLIPVLLTAPILIAGCSKDEGEGRIKADEPQPDNQRARTREQEVAYLTNMLSSEDEGKVRRAIYWLIEYAADSSSAIPALEKVAETHKNETLKQGA